MLAFAFAQQALREALRPTRLVEPPSSPPPKPVPRAPLIILSSLFLLTVGEILFYAFRH